MKDDSVAFDFQFLEVNWTQELAFMKVMSGLSSQCLILSL